MSTRTRMDLGVRDMEGELRACAQTRARLSEFLDGELSVPDRELVQAHLDGCARCRRVLEELRQTVALLRGLRGGIPDATSVEESRGSKKRPNRM